MHLLNLPLFYVLKTFLAVLQQPTAIEEGAKNQQQAWDKRSVIWEEVKQNSDYSSICNMNQEAKRSLLLFVLYFCNFRFPLNVLISAVKCSITSDTAGTPKLKAQHSLPGGNPLCNLCLIWSSSWLKSLHQKQVQCKTVMIRVMNCIYLSLYVYQ